MIIIAVQPEAKQQIYGKKCRRHSRKIAHFFFHSTLSLSTSSFLFIHFSPMNNLRQIQPKHLKNTSSYNKNKNLTSLFFIFSRFDDGEVGFPFFLICALAFCRFRSCYYIFFLLFIHHMLNV